MAGERSRERQLVLDASEEVEGVRERDSPDRRCLGEGVRAGAGRCTTACGSDWRHDATAERDFELLW